MRAADQREAGKAYVAALFQSDDLVGGAARPGQRLCPAATAEAVAADDTCAGNRDIPSADAADQAVRPVVVAVILIFVPSVRLGDAVIAGRCRAQCRAVLEEQRDAVF